MPQQASIGRDYFTAPWCYLIWGAPVAVEVIAGAAYDQGVLSVNLMGTALVLSGGLGSLASLMVGLAGECTA
jgi:hypothetical protein